MKWKKLGHVFTPPENHPWMKSHAAYPTAEQLDGDLYRIYFATRDSSNRSQIAYLELDMSNPFEILKIAEKPVFENGQADQFDRSGVTIACIQPHQDQRFLYYLGWNVEVEPPFENKIGIAVSDEKMEHFQRFTDNAIVDLDDSDPISLSYPWVLKEQDTWKMWYGTHIKWTEDYKSMLHVLKYAESKDGINWGNKQDLQFPIDDPKQYAFSRPVVINDNGLYRLWYTYRGDEYRIGYAESHDGLKWTRKDDQVGIDVSDSGWDSDAICYPHIFDHDGKRYMFYNGNRYGYSGFGLAVLED